MVQISAVALFLIGMAVGVVFGVFGVIIVALKYKGENKEGRNGNK